MQVVVLKRIPYESDILRTGIPKKRGIPSGGEAEVAPSPGGDQQRGWSDTSKTPETKKAQTKKKPYTPEV